MFDYSKLDEKILEKYKKKIEFAKEMNWSEEKLLLKLSGKRTWKQEEICRAVSILKLMDEEIVEYFFNLKVQNIELFNKKKNKN